MDEMVKGMTQNPPDTYDYRLYDRIWQRISPDLVPYPQLREEERADAPVDPPPMSAAAEGDLPGAEINPCCMGSAALDSLQVLEGFISQTLAERRCYGMLAKKLTNPSVCRLMRNLWAENGWAVCRLQAAHYLMTGREYSPMITVERLQWRNLEDLLRSSYHQLACDGFNYQRSAEETTDPCLQQLFEELSRRTYQQARKILDLLGQILCENKG